MHKKFLSIFFFLLCVATLCSKPAFATTTRASSQIMSYSAVLTETSGGQLRIAFSIKAIDIMEKIGATKVVVQRYNGSNWVAEYTFTLQNTPALQTSGRSFYAVELPYSPKYPQSTYRAVVYFYVKGVSEISTTIGTSNSV